MTEPSTTPTPLDDDAFLAALLNTFIPPAERMPGAGAIGLAEEIRAQLASNPALAAPTVTALAAVRDAALSRDPGGLPALDAEAREEVLKATMAQQPMLGMFQMFVFGGYYQNPEVREALGQPGRAPFPEGHEIEPTAEDLLEALRARQR